MLKITRYLAISVLTLIVLDVNAASLVGNASYSVEMTVINSSRPELVGAGSTMGKLVISTDAAGGISMFDGQNTFSATLSGNALSSSNVLSFPSGESANYSIVLTFADATCAAFAGTLTRVSSNGTETARVDISLNGYVSSGALVISP